MTPNQLLEIVMDAEQKKVGMNRAEHKEIMGVYADIFADCTLGLESIFCLMKLGEQRKKRKKRVKAKARKGKGKR